MVSGREITPIRHFEGCAANAHFSKQICRQKCVVVAHRDKGTDGLYLVYYPFGTLRDVPLMRIFLNKFVVKTVQGQRSP